MMNYSDYKESDQAILVKHRDGRKFLVKHSDQEKKFPGKGDGKLLVTPTNDDWEPLENKKKRVVSENKLSLVGFQD